MKVHDITIILCCAGMGTRLGIGTTKALVDIAGKPLIIRQLELMDQFDDIRIVVGYQAERVIEVVNKYRKDIMFAFNYQYETTGVADSLIKGSIGARKYVIALDGDVLVNLEDFQKIVEFPEECICWSANSSEEPIYVRVNEKSEIVSFDPTSGEYEWCGIAKIESKHIKREGAQVYEMLKPLLPLSGLEVQAKDIDTPDDYDNAVRWFMNGGKC